MRTPLVAGNWKMNTTIGGAVALAGEVAAGVERMAAVDVCRLPSVSSPCRPWRARCTGLGPPSALRNMHFEESGAFHRRGFPNHA